MPTPDFSSFPSFSGAKCSKANKEDKSITWPNVDARFDVAMKYEVGSTTMQGDIVEVKKLRIKDFFNSTLMSFEGGPELGGGGVLGGGTGAPGGGTRLFAVGGWGVLVFSSSSRTFWSFPVNLVDMFVK